jgi:hypothetical protein
MNPTSRLVLSVTALGVILLSQPAVHGQAPAAPPATAKPKMEVCFVLDTTGSMGGLIQGAKDKIWSIANEMVSAKPTPEIRFGLIGYRDRGDEYVTQVYPLSEDLDDIYGKLMAFQAQGGGDTPESVNQALHEAVTKMDWSPDKHVLKIVFLVGDAPPQMGYQDDVKYPETCQLAVSKDLVINTIQCGAMAETTPVWNDIADKAEGEYAAILQDGGTIAVATPFDERISAVNRSLAGTVIGYGDDAVQMAVSGKLAAAAAAKAEAAADRADYLVKTKSAPAASAKVISGSEDLVALVEEGKLDLDKVEEEKLPPPLRSLPKEEQRALVEKNLAERHRLNAELEELVRKRSEFLEEEKKRLAAEGKADGFDARVKQMIQRQAASKGIGYGTGSGPK